MSINKRFLEIVLSLVKGTSTSLPGTSYRTQTVATEELCLDNLIPLEGKDDDPLIDGLIRLYRINTDIFLREIKQKLRTHPGASQVCILSHPSFNEDEKTPVYLCHTVFYPRYSELVRIIFETYNTSKVSIQVEGAIIFVNQIT
jgi:hypothetical protein